MHQIEILRAPYVLQLFFPDFLGIFSALNSNVFVQDNFFITFEKSYFFIIFKNENKFLLDKYFGILGWKNAQKIRKKKLKNIRCPQNFDLMHSFMRKSLVKTLKKKTVVRRDMWDFNFDIEWTSRLSLITWWVPFW